MDSYIFGAFAHRLKQVLSKERVIEFVPTNQELAELKGTQDWDWVTNFENLLELKKMLSQTDDWTKEALFRRSFGHSWARIAQDLGITEHQAKMRFSDRLKKVREKIVERDNPIA